MSLILLIVSIILTSPWFWLIVSKPIIIAQFYIPTFEGFLINFFSYLSFNFLFFEGDLNIRNSVPEIGAFLLWTLPFYLIGLYLILTKKKSDKLIIIICILSLFFASFFKPSPNLLVSLPICLLNSIIIARGIIYSLTYLKKKPLFLIFIILLIIYNLIFFYHQYKIHYPKRLQKIYG